MILHKRDIVIMLFVLIWCPSTCCVRWGEKPIQKTLSLSINISYDKMHSDLIQPYIIVNRLKFVKFQKKTSFFTSNLGCNTDAKGTIPK